MDANRQGYTPIIKKVQFKTSSNNVSGDQLNLPQIDGVDQAANHYITDKGQSKLALKKMGKMTFEEGSNISNSVGFLSKKKDREAKK